MPSTAQSGSPTGSAIRNTSPSTGSSVSACTSAAGVGSISGKVKSDDDIGDTNLAGVLFTLLDINMDVATTVTNSSGNYVFTNRSCV